MEGLTMEAQKLFAGMLDHEHNFGNAVFMKVRSAPNPCPLYRLSDSFTYRED